MSEKTPPPKSGKPSTVSVSEAGADSKSSVIDSVNTAAEQPVLDQGSVNPSDVTETSTAPVASANETAGDNRPVLTATALTPELGELLSELKDTVRQFNARRLTTKTLRRSLVNVRSIIDELETLLNPKPSVD